MLHWLQHQALTAGITSVLAAIADWATLGLLAGFCLQEYEQPSVTIWKKWMNMGNMGLLPRKTCKPEWC